MARKGKEIQLQQEIETQEEWEDMLSKEGLCVIDVSQEWCGPVSAMLGTFKRIKNELGDDLLKFVIAKADNIDALEKYRGRCEPCFLFYAGGVLVAVIRGANAPLILRTITEQLAQEHKVLDGQAERKEIKDTRISELEEQDKQAEEEEEVEVRAKPGQARRINFQGEIIEFGDDIYSEPVKEVSVVIIKPDAVQSGKAEEIMTEMKKRGIEILRQDERQLTEEEVKNVYIHLQDEEFFGELVTFMTSSPSIVLAITKGKTGQNVIKEFRDLIGPTEVEDAKEQAPESLRAKFGQEKYMNAVHGSDSSDTAARELAFFFPDFVAPKCEGKAKLQRTLALVRPDAYKKNKDEILAKIRESGFKVAMSKEIHLTKEQAEDFYSEHRGQDYFGELTDRMSSGPLLALGLAREDAINGWRDMLGPTKVDEAKEQQPDSLRAQFSEEGAQINMLHGSDSEATAKKELEYFFPVEQTVAVIKPDAIGTKDEIIEKIHEAGFRIAARKETTLSKEIAEEFYADHKDKEYYNELVEHMSSGPTYFMVLSREGAVDGWRSLIGPTDPAKAKEMDPDTLRGMFGTDTLRNAVHGSSNPDHAKSQIAKIFGELFFNKDGTLRDDEEVATSEQQESTFEGAPEYGKEDEDDTRTDAKSPTQQEVNEDKEGEGDEQKESDDTPKETTEDETEKGQEQQAEAKEEPKPAQEQEPSKPAEEQTPTEKPDESGTTETEPQQQQQQEEEKPQQQQEEEKPQQQQEEQQQQQQEEQQQQSEQTEQTQAEDKPKSPEPVQEEKPAETEEKQEEQKPAEESQKPDEPAPTEQTQEEQTPTEEQKPAEEQTTAEEPKADADEQKADDEKKEETQKPAEGDK